MERLKKILIHPGQTIKQVLRHMDSVGEKTMLVADKGKKLLGTVTDGDIRRWILRGRGLHERIEKVMNKAPFVLRTGFLKEEAQNLMREHYFECLPVVNEANTVVSALWWTDLFEQKPKNGKNLKCPVVIMAGGEGTRLFPFTKILPKPLMPIGEKPVLEVIIEKFFECGCTEFYLPINYKANIIRAYFSDFRHKYKITFVHEQKPLGTAGGISLLRDRIKSTFFVSNCDILIEADYADIMSFHQKQNNKITLVSSMKNFTIPYGVCEMGNGGTLKRIREKPEFDFLVSTGMYVLEPDVIKDIPENKFFNSTDLIAKYLLKEKKIGIYPISEKSWLDMGELQELQNTLKKFEAKQ